MVTLSVSSAETQSQRQGAGRNVGAPRDPEHGEKAHPVAEAGPISLTVIAFTARSGNLSSVGSRHATMRSVIVTSSAAAPQITEASEHRLYRGSLALLSA
jgi:hypothetical protein